MFLRVLQHLLPNARAWRITVNKFLRQYFDGLSTIGDDLKIFYDEIWQDIDPETTRELDLWNSQFGLTDTGLSVAEQRERLAAAWRAVGGQDPRYLQNTLQENGFDVYVHEWWVPGSEPAVNVKACVVPRNPQMYLRSEYTQIFWSVECDEAIAECGEVFAECGNSLQPRGYPLVNKVYVTTPKYIVLCGEAAAECGEADIECGAFSELVTGLQNYIVPLDSTKWPYFLYIGGQTFGDLAQIDPQRKDEFEALCLKICPTQLWLGILVEYV